MMMTSSSSTFLFSSFSSNSTSRPTNYPRISEGSKIALTAVCHGWKKNGRHKSTQHIWLGKLLGVKRAWTRVKRQNYLFIVCQLCARLRMISSERAYQWHSSSKPASHASMPGVAGLISVPYVPSHVASLPALPGQAQAIYHRLLCLPPRDLSNFSELPENFSGRARFGEIKSSRAANLSLNYMPAFVRGAAITPCYK